MASRHRVHRRRDERACWCEPGHDGKCWERSQKSERVHHILKGGEDSIGALEAIQRVYFNIGSCSEQCWVNHITDLRQADPKHRGFGQTPFDIGQCRRDCTNFRAVEDRLQNIADFFMTSRPVDLYRARGLPSQEALVAQLDREFGANAVAARARGVCGHLRALPFESKPAPWTRHDRLPRDRRGPARSCASTSSATSEPVPVTEVGTSRSRALHSNHMKGHVWEEYGSDTLTREPPVDGIPEPARWRARLLPSDLAAQRLGVRAVHAQQRHRPRGLRKLNRPARVLSKPVRVRGTWMRMPNPPPCVTFDPSVEGRYRLFKASVEELLNPDALPKITLVDQPIIIDGPMFPGETQGFQAQIPAGIPAAIPANLRHKELIGDLVLVKTNVDRLRSKYASRGPADVDRIVATLQDILKQLTAGVVSNPDQWCRRSDAITCRSSSRCIATAPSRSRTRGTRSEAPCPLRTRRR